MEDILDRGGSLLLFVEGTYMGAQEGHLQEVRGGAAHLSQISHVPLVPVGISGTKELWFRRTLTLRIGNAIPPERFEGSLRERVHSMTSQLTNDLQRLLPSERERAHVKLLRNWLTGLFDDGGVVERPSRKRVE
jgi:1-acyl-sn-glycerol-3-phosphate acyltransferase